MSVDSKATVTAASARSAKLTPAEAVALVGHAGTVFVDVREGAELAKTGTIKGAVHVSRSFLEFKADPQSPTHETALASGKHLVLFCGSGARAALAAKTLADMGLKPVSHVSGGGFDALKEAGAPVVEHKLP